MPVHWEEQEKSDIKQKGRLNGSKERSEVVDNSKPEARLGTADWRAFVREVHLLQKEKKMLLLNSSYFPKTKR